MYYIYCDFLERKGFTVVTVPERTDGLHAEDVEARIDALRRLGSGISFLYVVTVNNPSATIISNRERTGAGAAGRASSRGSSGRIVPLVLDKAYEDLIHDPAVRAAPLGTPGRRGRESSSRSARSPRSSPRPCASAT